MAASELLIRFLSFKIVKVEILDRNKWHFSHGEGWRRISFWYHSNNKIIGNFTPKINCYDMTNFIE